MTHELQHHIPQFFLDPWCIPGKENAAFVEPIFRCGENKSLKSTKLSKILVCSGYHLWSYDESHQDRTIIEKTGLQDIDSKGAISVKKLRTGVPTSDVEKDDFALFVASLYSRYPEVIGRLVMEARTLKLEILTDPETEAHNIDNEALYQEIQKRLGGSFHNYSLGKWEDIHKRSPLRRLINESKFSIINAPHHDLLPLTDRPLFFPPQQNRNGNFLLIIALNPHSLLCMYTGDHNRRIVPKITHSHLRAHYRAATLSQAYMFSFDRRPIIAEYQRYFNPRFVVPTDYNKFFTRKSQMRDPLVTYRDFYHDDGTVNLLRENPNSQKDLEELKEHDTVLRRSFGGRGLIMPN